MKIIVSHPTGNANVRAAVKGLQRAGILYRFYTTVACFQHSWYYKLLKGPLSPFRKRTFDEELAAYIKTHPLNELGRMLSDKLNIKKWLTHDTGRFSVHKIYQNLDRFIAKELEEAQKKGVDFVYAYEDGALLSFRGAKKIGITCVYDLPIGYWRSMHSYLNDEREFRPDWASTLNGFRDTESKLLCKDEELSLADHIFVASSFTKETLLSYPGTLAKISVIPYAFPNPFLERQYDSMQGRKMKLLFVGGLSQRKGIANILEAVKDLSARVELTIIGKKITDDCVPLNNGLKVHRYIPSLPHNEILMEMRNHDVFLFPSLFEGFGLVVTEAMSQGTPVITTNRTCGPDLIVHGSNGWIVEAASSKALRIQIERLLEFPEEIERNGRNALDTARKRPWSVYEMELANAMQNLENDTLNNDKF